MTKKYFNRLVLACLWVCFVLVSSDATAQLKSDLILSPNRQAINNTKSLTDSSFLNSPILFNNSDYLLPTGFFCKLELGLDKKSGVPIRFRLGSVDYVNYLEGKDESGKIEAGIE